MKSQAAAVAVVFVLLILSTLIADGDCQKGRKREIEVKVIPAHTSSRNIMSNLRVPFFGILRSS